MSGILVPFLKQIVGDFVFKTKVLDGLPLRHCLRFVTDEQMLKIAAAIHYYWIFDYSSKGRDFYSLGEDVIFGRLQDIYVIKMGYYLIYYSSIKYYLTKNEYNCLQ